MLPPARRTDSNPKEHTTDFSILYSWSPHAAEPMGSHWPEPFHDEPKLRMRGAMHGLIHTPSWYGT